MRRQLAQPIPFARYRLVERIGHGVMATRDRATIAGTAGSARAYVAKTMLRQMAADPGFVEMSMTAGRLAARLAGPSSARVYEPCIGEGPVFLGLECGDGIDMA